MKNKVYKKQKNIQLSSSSKSGPYFYQIALKLADRFRTWISELYSFNLHTSHNHDQPKKTQKIWTKYLYSYNTVSFQLNILFPVIFNGFDTLLIIKNVLRSSLHCWQIFDHRHHLQLSDHFRVSKDVRLD